MTTATLKSYALWGLAFIGAILVIQIGGLQFEIIDWDESTFMMMAQDILRGHLPYTHQFDNKPPGMFFVLAVMMELFGQSVLVARATGWLTLLTMALATFAVARPLAGSRPAGLATLAMIAATATRYGYHLNTEFAATALVIVALWALLRRGEAPWSSALVGLSLSLAVLIRSNLAFVVVAVGILYALAIVMPKLRLHRLALAGFILAGLVPPAILVTVYALTGSLEDLYLSVVTVPLSYATDGISMLEAIKGNFWGIGSSIRYNPIVFGGFTALALAGIPRLIAFWRDDAPSPRRRDLIIIGVIFCAIVISILRGGAAYPHYLLQIFPFAAFGAAFALKAGLSTLDKRILYPVTALVIAGSLAMEAPQTLHVLLNYREITSNYPVRLAADAIAADRAPGDRIWSQDLQLINFYLDAPPVIPGATHPNNIARPAIADPLIAAGYMQADPLAEIFALRPRYVVTDDDGPARYFPDADLARISAFLMANYDRWFENDTIRVYRLRP